MAQRSGAFSNALAGRLLSQPFFVAEIFTGKPGRFVELPQTIDSFEQLLKGERDDIPEAAFYMVGDMDEARGVDLPCEQTSSGDTPQYALRNHSPELSWGNFAVQQAHDLRQSGIELQHLWSHRADTNPVKIQKPSLS